MRFPVSAADWRCLRTGMRCLSGTATMHWSNRSKTARQTPIAGAFVEFTCEALERSLICKLAHAQRRGRSQPRYGPRLIGSSTGPWQGATWPGRAVYLRHRSCPWPNSNLYDWLINCVVRSPLTPTLLMLQAVARYWLRPWYGRVC
jgi:hypothetical protein